MVKILVVDDSAVDRLLAGGLLQKQGWDVLFAEDGEQALSSLAVNSPDLIITDLQMPEMNGLELVQKVRQSHPLVPVVLMTGKGSETIAVEALQAGASSYVPKSQLADMLVEITTRMIALAGEKKTKKTLMRRLESMACRFVLSNDSAMLTSLVSHLQGILGEMELLTDGEILRVGVALEEALLNAAFHGNLEVSSELRELDHAAYYELAQTRAHESPYQQRSIYVDVNIDSTGLTYVIQDEGPGFDPGALPDPTDPAYLERPFGRGLLLMRTFMDQVTFNDTGNRVTMLKQRAASANALI